MILPYESYGEFLLLLERHNEVSYHHQNKDSYTGKQWNTAYIHPILRLFRNYQN